VVNVAIGGASALRCEGRQSQGKPPVGQILEGHSSSGCCSKTGVFKAIRTGEGEVQGSGKGTVGVCDGGGRVCLYLIIHF